MVTALDAAGNASGRSPEVEHCLYVVITTVEALGEARRATARTAVGDGTPFEAQVTHRRRVPPPKPVIGHSRSRSVSAQSTASPTYLALGVVRGRAARGNRPVAGSRSSGGAGHVRAGGAGIGGRRPDLGRVHTGAGMVLDVVPSADLQPPAAPVELRLVDVGDDHVTIGWPNVDAEDLQRYVVYRSTTDAPEPGAPSRPPWTRSTRTRAWPTGTRYDYVVTAQDLAFNESPPSPPLGVDAAELIVSGHIPRDRAGEHAGDRWPVHRG